MPRYPDEQKRPEGWPAASPGRQDFVYGRDAVPPQYGGAPNFPQPDAAVRSADPSNDELLGTVYVGRYELNSILGTGGMGVIYLGRQIFLDRPVAVKLLKSNLASAKARARFQQEAKAASALNHKGIVSVIEFGIDELERPYMVMEYVEGCTLSELLAERLTLPLEDVLPVFLEVCDALSVAHKKRIVHRDLKPSNIMLIVGDDGDVQIKLLDFGVAKMLDTPDRTRQNLTKTGDMIGTPLYMSPEQIEGEEVTPSSDLYSLGCTMYACLTGIPPFVAETKMQIMEMHCSERPPSLKEASEGMEFPPGIEAIVMKLLEKRPEDRFESVDQLKKALVEWGERSQLTPPIVAADPRGRVPSQDTTSKFSKAISDRVHASLQMKPDTLQKAYGSLGGRSKIGEGNDAPDDDTTFWNSELPIAPNGPAGNAAANKFGKKHKLPLRGNIVETGPKRSASFLSLRITIAVGSIIAGVCLICFFANMMHLFSWNVFTSFHKSKTANELDAKHLPVVQQSVKDSGTHFSELHAPGADYPSGRADRVISELLADGALNESISLEGMNGLSITGIKKLASFKKLTRLNLTNTHFDDEFAKVIATLPLRRLILNDNLGVGDETLRELAKIKTLTHLSLVRTGISNQGLKFLTKLDSLGMLILTGNTQITNEGLKNLDPCHSSIQWIGLAECSVDDSWVEGLGTFKHLLALDVRDNFLVSDGAVKIVADRLPNLIWLNIGSDNISERGIHFLQRLKKLQQLDLNGIIVNEQAVSELKRMKQLTVLYVSEESLSPALIRSLKSASPRIDIRVGSYFAESI